MGKRRISKMQQKRVVDGGQDSRGDDLLQKPRPSPASPEATDSERSEGGGRRPEWRPTEASKGKFAARAGESGPSNPRTLQDAGAEAQCRCTRDSREEIGGTRNRGAYPMAVVCGGGVVVVCSGAATLPGASGQRVDGMQTIQSNCEI